MEQSTLSLSSSVSKESVYEGMSVVLAGIEDYKKQQIDGKEEEIISNERIQKNDIILGTYQVSSDAISGEWAAFGAFITRVGMWIWP